ncbi:MAG: sterol desaturase family protein [Pseudomonadota bacterium]
MENEPVIRLSVFLGVFLLCAGWEALRPKRDRVLTRARRWSANIGLVVVDTFVVRLLFPAAAVGAAVDASTQGWGLFNQTDWPLWLEVLAAFVILDFAIWVQHVVFHKVPFLWRFHMVHHADEEMDVTTGFRFHPVEIAASMAIKIGLVYALGAAAVAVILFEVMLSAAALWSHSNTRLSERVERIVRWFVVTPDMHRSHHSVERREHDTNYGFFLSVWDRLFGQYTETPEGGHDGVRIGLKPWRDGQSASLLWAAAAPFRAPYWKKK